MNAWPPGQRPRRRVLGAGIATAIALMMLTGLGFWQLERKAWKEALIKSLSARLASATIELPVRGVWPALDAAHDEFRRVAFAAELLTDREAFVYATSSGRRGDASGPGYWVFTPVRLAGGGTIVVNRGFIPQDRKDQANGSTGLVDVVGIMRWPERRGLFTPKDDPAHNLWFARDPGAIAAGKGWGEVAPFYVEMEQPIPRSGLPRPGAISVNLPNDHLGYAVTWFGLAGALAVIFLIWSRKQPPETALLPPPGASL